SGPDRRRPSEGTSAFSLCGFPFHKRTYFLPHRKILGLAHIAETLRCAHDVFYVDRKHNPARDDAARFHHDFRHLALDALDILDRAEYQKGVMHAGTHDDARLRRRDAGDTHKVGTSALDWKIQQRARLGLAIYRHGPTERSLDPGVELRGCDRIA